MINENGISRRSFVAGAAALAASLGLALGSAASAARADDSASADEKAGSDSAAADSNAADSAEADSGYSLADIAPIDERTTLKVAASPSPHAIILDHVKDALSELNVDLEVTEFTDYVQPNNVVESGEQDANYFQHLPYLENFNEENGTHLKAIGKIHFEPMGIFAGRTSSLDDVADGATIAIPNDTTNEARALLLLEAQGLITVDENAGLAATPKDITDNPKNLSFSEVEAAAVARTLQDCDLGVVNGNYALDAGLKISDALATESADSDAAEQYANVICVKEENADSPAANKLVEVLKASDVQDWITENFEGAVVPVNFDVEDEDQE
jgi:D-methionine transport system substrate-binding protein